MIICMVYYPHLFDTRTQVILVSVLRLQSVGGGGLMAFTITHHPFSMKKLVLKIL